MAKLFLGTREVTPAIYNKSSSNTEFPSYQIVNGVASRRSGALTGNEFSDITSVDTYGLYYAFYYCSGLTGLDLSSLTSIGDYGIYGAFAFCSGLTSVNLSSLTTIGRSGLYYAFRSCSGLTDVYFNSLTTTSFGSYTNQFQNMLSGTGTSVAHTLHFPSNLESTISGLTGYPTFGGTSGYVVCAFDLPATS